MRRFSNVVWLIGTMLGVAGCASVGSVGREEFSGTSGQIAWEVVEIVRTVAANQRAIRWDYTIVLRETNGIGVELESRELSASGRELMASTVRQDFRRRIPARGDLRLNDSYTVTYTPSASASFGEIPGSRYGYTRHLRFRGKSDAGVPIDVRIIFPLTAMTGQTAKTRADASLVPSARHLEAGEVNTLAGVWNGHYRNESDIDIPVSVTVGEDGSFEATEGDPIRNRFRGSLGISDGRVTYATRNDKGTLTLHEGPGKRVLVGQASGPREGQGNIPPSTFRYAIRLEATTPLAAQQPPNTTTGTGPPSASASVTQDNLSGSYKGTISGEHAARPYSADVTFTIIQSQKEVSGTWVTATGSGTVSGTVLSNSRLTFRVKQMTPCAAEYGGIGTIADRGRVLGGSYSGAGCQGHLTATFSVVRQ